MHSNRAFSCFSFLIAVASAVFESYNPDSYPDSQRDWTACRVPEPSLVCDPNQVLNSDKDGSEGIIQIHRALQRLRANTNCSCGQNPGYIPGSDPPRLGSTVGVCEVENPHGYTVSVAVLKKMLVDERYPRSMEELVSVFSNALRNRFNRGQCQDDAFIVFSVDDGAVWTSTGPNIAQKLTHEFTTLVSIKSQGFFARNDHTGALLYIINEYAKQLGAMPELGESVKLEEEECWWERNLWSRVPEWWSQSSWRWPILIVVLLLLILLVVGFVYTGYRLIALFYARARHRQDGYEMGRAVGKN